MNPLSLLLQLAHAREKKRRPALPKIFSRAVVNTDLRPKGSVLVAGELWMAEASDRQPIPQQTEVTVVGFRNHVLVVADKS